MIGGGLAIAAMAVAVFPNASGQDRSTSQSRSEARVAANPQQPGERMPAPEDTGQGIAAWRKAAAANKYLFVFFYRERNRQTDGLWEVFQRSMNKVPDAADWVAVQAGDPAEKRLVDRFDATRAPMPLVLALAPNGAVTKGFAGKFSEDQLRQAFVSPCTAHCLKALQDRKLVLLCVQDPGPQAGQVSLPPGVNDFAADPRYAQTTQVVLLNPTDRNEASFLKELGVEPRTSGPIVAFLAPPGSLIGKFAASVTKDQLAASLAAAQSDPCAGGKCGPNGCGPKR
jgi:hypothetical protein